MTHRDCISSLPDCGSLSTIVQSMRTPRKPFILLTDLPARRPWIGRTCFGLRIQPDLVAGRTTGLPRET